MLKVGITGGIGSGKSTVTDLFAKLGVPIIDADAISRSLTNNNKHIQNKIFKHFGETFLLQDGNLDRKKLRNYIFQHPKERAWLEALLHPSVKKTIRQQLKTLRAPYCIIAIPLLLETHSTDLVNRILVIDCPQALQIQRIRQRDSASIRQVKAIIRAQIPRKERIKQADEIINNKGSLKELKKQVKNLHIRYSKFA